MLDRVSAVLIDLDGTMYNPLGAIPGADEFYAYLVRRKIPYVFCQHRRQGQPGHTGLSLDPARLCTCAVHVCVGSAGC